VSGTEVASLSHYGGFALHIPPNLHVFLSGHPDWFFLLTVRRSTVTNWENPIANAVTEYGPTLTEDPLLGFYTLRVPEPLPNIVSLNGGKFFKPDSNNSRPI